MNYQSNTNNIDILSKPVLVQQQLSFIDFSLYFKGHLTLHDLQVRFNLSPIEVKEAFELYSKLADDNTIYDEQSHRYFQTSNFKPLFDYDVKNTLIKLSNSLSDGFDSINSQPLPIQNPSYLNPPDIVVVARLVQAIMNNNSVNMIYTSLSSGSASREFVPHSIIDNGLRWHVRGYDRKTQGFRDFVLTRISKVTIKPIEVQRHESKSLDADWNEPITLQLVPHPQNIKVPTAIEMDYGMTDGLLEIQTNSALAGYLLRRWNVDCTSSATLNGAEYQLWLKNGKSLRNVNTLKLAPGIE